MLHFWTLDHLNLQRTWLTIGSFDGIHLGHQAILRKIVQESHKVESQAVVLTFHPHPGVLLGKREGAFYLSSPEEKAEFFAGLGVDVLITHPFNRIIAGLSAREFVVRLKKHLDFQRICVGTDFALGKNREGNLQVLGELGQEFGFIVEAFHPVELEGQIISSSWVRKALAEGDMATVERLLGRAYQVQGEVVHGEGRGKSLGFATANLEIWQERALPKPGVYAGWARIDGRKIAAVTNVGFRPTFENQSSRPHVEAHLLDFDQDLYHHQIELSFHVHIRDEQRFSSVQSLVDQIHKDISQARSVLEVSDYETIPGFTSAYS